MSLFICFTVVKQCRTEDLSQLSLNIQRYAKFHFSSNEGSIKNDFYASMQSIHNRLASSVSGLSTNGTNLSDIYLLPGEVVLIRNVLSGNEQKRLFELLASSVSQSLSTVQVNPSLCPSCQCSLHTWKLNETLDQTGSEVIGTLGEVLYLKAASFLNVQQTIRTKNSITNLLHSPPVHQRPSFKYLHGVLYGMNDTLGPHFDKTWSTITNSTYEWVISISLGHSAIFSYRKNNHSNLERTTQIVLNSGDLLFFNGAYLEHSMPYILKNEYPSWWYTVDTFQKARLNIQYRLLGEKDFHQSQSPTDVISGYDTLNSSTSFLDSQYKEHQSLVRTDNVSDIHINNYGYQDILTGQANAPRNDLMHHYFFLESSKQMVIFSTSWMNRIFNFTQSNHEVNRISYSLYVCIIN
jgi:hypothetical protein